MTAKDYMVLRRSLAKHDEVSLGIGNDLRCRKKNAYDMQPAALNRRPRNVNEHLCTNADNRRKPFFVIHAGPHKTATTTLQTALSQWDEVLKKDNYVYLGKHLPNLYNAQSAIYKALFSDTITVAAQKYYQDIDGHDTPAAVPPLWNDLLTELDLYSDRNLIISEEGFGFRWSDDEVSNPYSVLRILMRALGDRWEVVVVVGYRRLFEWIPSAKQEMERYNKRKTNLDLWPSQGGHARAPLFPKYVLNNPYVKQSAEQVHGYRFTTDLLDYFNKFNDAVSTIKILDFHASVGVQTEFFCRILPDAPNACSEAASRPSPVVNAHDSYYAYDELVTAAAANGWIDTQRCDRHNVTMAAKKYHHSKVRASVSDMAKTCPLRAELEIFLEASLRMEARVFANEGGHNREAELNTKDAFWAAVNAKEFCSVDTEAELQLRHWEMFFSFYGCA